MVLKAEDRRQLQLSELLNDDSFVVGPPSLLMSNKEIWDGKPWIVDFLTPICQENYYRFPDDIHIQESSAMLEKIALLLGSHFIFAHDMQFELRKKMYPDIVDEFSKKDFSVIPPVPANFSFSPKNNLYLIWGGGGWDWLDPKTFVEAVSIADTKYKGVIFSDRYNGAFFRNAAMKGLSSEKVEINRFTAKKEYLEYVNNALAWVSLHSKESIEAPIAYRTRLLDAMICSKPVIVTQGEHLGDFIVENGGGWFVDHEDPEHLASIIEKLKLSEVNKRGLISNSLLKKMKHQGLKGIIVTGKPSVSKARELYLRLKKSRLILNSFSWRFKSKILGQR